MPQLNRIVETALYVDDLERAHDFYEGKLGLAPLLKTPILYAYDVGGATVLLLFRRGAAQQTQSSANGSIPPHDGSGPLHIAFAVDSGELAESANLAELDHRLAPVLSRSSFTSAAVIAAICPVLAVGATHAREAGRGSLCPDAVWENADAPFPAVGVIGVKSRGGLRRADDAPRSRGLHYASASSRAWATQPSRSILPPSLRS
ncbi:hypothetical protein BTHI11S_04528 [Bosea thiooxidans]